MTILVIFGVTIGATVELAKIVKNPNYSNYPQTLDFENRVEFNLDT